MDFIAYNVLQIDKWASKPAMGDRVWPSRFIPCKTPLTAEHILAHFPDAESCPNPHTVPIMLEECRTRGVQLGMIMNLSAHEGLYASDIPADLPTFHVSIASKHLPSRHEVNAVIERAAQFWEQDPDACIAVHCAYGARP